MRKKFFPIILSALSHLPFFGARSEIKPAHEPPAIIDTLALEISARIPVVAGVIKKIVVCAIKNKFGHSRKLNRKLQRRRMAV